MIDTRETLLSRLRVENAHEAWKEFYHLYWGAILRYARKLGLNEHQAEEVLQETMVALMRVLPEFAYDRGKGKFRNFLLTIVHRKSLATLRRVARSADISWDEAEGAHSVDPFHNGDAPEAEALRRWQETLTEEAICRVREDARLEGHTFAVFEAYVIQRRPVADVARQFGLKENAIYQIRNRLLRRVQAEIARLIKNSGGERP